jgi:two-component system sensor histidine kinase HydH
MEQVLINLLRNALQASPDGAEVDFTVAEERRALSFEVRDRGEGIVEAEAEQIFEPFQTNRVRGTGLGLAVAKRIVEGHGGRISASNHPDGGAVFRVLLPRRPGEG